MKRVLPISVIALLTAVDQHIKLAVVSNLKPVGEITVIDKIFGLNYVENSGAVFGFLSSHTNLLSVVTAVIIAVGIALILMKKIKSTYILTCVTIVIAGGLGNLIDRIRLGYVIDYLEFLFMNFAVFNFADCLVTLGAVMMIGFVIYDTVMDMKKKEKDA